MFLTGPRIVKRALGEEVTRVRARRRESARPQRRVRLRRRGRPRCDPAAARAARLPAAQRVGRGAGRARRGARRGGSRRSPAADEPQLLRRAGPDQRAWSTVAASARSHERWARNMVVGFARLEGNSIAVVANQARHRGGIIDVEASQKGRKFIRTCDALRHPDARAGGHARLHAGKPAGGCWGDQPRSRAAAGVRRHELTAGHGDRAQGVRRRLHHDELKGSRC